MPQTFIIIGVKPMKVFVDQTTHLHSIKIEIQTQYVCVCACEPLEIINNII
jgi:hypothetical protein